MVNACITVHKKADELSSCADQCITFGLPHICRYGPGQSFGKHVDDSVDMGDGKYTEYTLLIYLSGSGSPAAKGKQKGVTKPSPGLLGGETIFYGNHLLGSEQFNTFLHPQSLHGTESSNAGKMLCLKCCLIAALQACVPCGISMSCLW